MGSCITGAQHGGTLLGAGRLEADDINRIWKRAENAPDPPLLSLSFPYP